MTLLVVPANPSLNHLTIRRRGKSSPNCTGGHSNPKSMKESRLVHLQGKMKEALRNRQYTKVVKLQAQIRNELQRKENVPLSTLLPKMTERQKEEGLLKMHKLFITADILYGFALEFENTIRKYDPSMETHVFRKVKEIAEISRGITRNVDDFHCQELSENFGNMCDECSVVLENVIYKYRQREKNRMKNEIKQ